MMSIDPTEDDDEGDPNKPNLNKIPTVLAKPAGTMEGAGDANSNAVIDLDDSGDRDELQVFIIFFHFYSLVKLKSLFAKTDKRF